MIEPLIDKLNDLIEMQDTVTKQLCQLNHILLAQLSISESLVHKLQSSSVPDKTKCFRLVDPGLQELFRKRNDVKIVKEPKE